MAVYTLKEFQTPKICVKKVINIKGICYVLCINESPEIVNM